MGPESSEPAADLHAAGEARSLFHRLGLWPHGRLAIEHRAQLGRFGRQGFKFGGVLVLRLTTIGLDSFRRRLRDELCGLRLRRRRGNGVCR